MLTMRQKQALSQTIKKRYKKAGKKEKGSILNEFVASTGYNRSYARRLFNNKKRGRKKTTRKREKFYDYQVFIALRKIWIAADNICSKRLHPYLPKLVDILIKFKEIEIDPKVKDKLLTISPSTIDRMLANTKKNYCLKGRSTTKPGSIKGSIPIRTFADWDESVPGFFEADLVALCGGSIRGDYVNCLNMVDVFTGWIALEAFMGKAQSRVHPAVDKIKNRLSFPMLGFDSDNGAEFINDIMKRYCKTNEITFTRIRPGRKNDNCFVEQKNYTVVRRFLDYARYDTWEQLAIIQKMVKLIEIYVNFFQPVMKLVSKKRTGARVRKKYDTAKTPYQRLLDSKILNRQKQQELKVFYNNLNPMELKRKINRLTIKLSKTFRYNLIESTNT